MEAMKVDIPTAINEFEQAIAHIRSRPANRITAELLDLMKQESDFAKKIIKHCVDAYDGVASEPEVLLAALTALANDNELRCLRYRAILDEIYRNGVRDEAGRKAPMPIQADFSADMELSYSEEHRVLRVKLPLLLPLKPAWNAYLPDKVRRRVEQFTDEYKAKAWNERQKYEIPRFSRALVILIHHYDEEKRVKHYYRDYDNQETSWIINALHSQRLFSDSAAMMIFMNMAVKDSESFTEILVTDACRALPVIRGIDPAIDTSLYETSDAIQ
jgi:hypothetical protein